MVVKIKYFIHLNDEKFQNAIIFYLSHFSEFKPFEGLQTSNFEVFAVKLGCC